MAIFHDSWRWIHSSSACSRQAHSLAAVQTNNGEYINAYVRCNGLTHVCTKCHSCGSVWTFIQHNVPWAYASHPQNDTLISSAVFAQLTYMPTDSDSHAVHTRYNICSDGPHLYTVVTWICVTLTRQLNLKIRKAFSISLHLWFCIRITITMITSNIASVLHGFLFEC